MKAERLALHGAGEMPSPAGVPGGMPTICCCSATDPEREKLEQYIAGIFHTSYGARILEFMPLLFNLRRDELFCAALGLRSAVGTKLFCEQYLDGVPAEDVVAQLSGVRCERRGIMELGNLVASTPGHGSLLYLLVTAAAWEAGVEYLLFAANRAVRFSIRRSGFTPRLVCPARRESLGDGGAQWGNYYDGDPRVMLGDLALTLAQAQAQPPLHRALRLYRQPIAALAEEIRSCIA
jgi:hypothetical protein